MEDKRIEQTYSQCVSLLTSLYTQSKITTKEHEQQAKEEVYSELINFVREMKRNNANPKIGDLKNFVTLQLNNLQSKKRVKQQYS